MDDHGTRYYVGCWARRKAVLGCIIFTAIFLSTLFASLAQGADVGGTTIGGATTPGGGIVPGAGNTSNAGGTGIAGGTGATGGTGITGWNTQNAGPDINPLHFALLLGASTVWILSLFMVDEAGKMATWALRNEPDAPRPDSGIFLSQMCAGATLFIWLMYVLLVDLRDFGPPRDDQWVVRIVLILVYRPIRLAPGFLVASILPAMVAVLKWSQAFAARSGGATTWRIAAVQMMTYLLSMAASVLALSQGFRQ